VLAIATVVGFHDRYGVLPTQTAHPWHVHICDRDYKDTGRVVSKADAAAEVAHDGTLERIGTFAPPVSFTPVWGLRTPSYATTPCGMTVYLEQPDGALREYLSQNGT